MRAVTQMHGHIHVHTPPYIYVPACTCTHHSTKSTPSPKPGVHGTGEKSEREILGQTQDVKEGGQWEGGREHRSGGGHRGSGGQSRREPTPLAGAGVPGLAGPPPRCVWSATSWAWASIHNALRAEGRGRQGKLILLHVHSHTRMHSRSRGQDSGPCGLEAGGPGREPLGREGGAGSHSDAEDERESPLASPNPLATGAPPGTPPYTRPGARVCN